jgi:probable F420-dependent oxidoreductase
MLFGCSVPFSDTSDLAAFVPRIAHAVEARGFESMWLGEHTHMPSDTRHVASENGVLPERYRRFPDPWTVLAAAAATTERIRLGTLIALVAEHNPLVLAKVIATVDQLSRGRVDVGVGLGWNPLEMRNNGVDPARKRAILTEKIAAMRELWSGDAVSFDGEFVNFTSSWSLPAPVQSGGPRIHLGCAPSSRNLAQVVEIADGFFPMSAMVDDDFAGVVARLRDQAASAGRDADAIQISVAHTGTSWGRADLEKFTRRLPSEAQLEAYRRHGVSRVVCSIPAGPDDLAERALDAWMVRCGLDT